ncbi:MAG TPA: hypothetical protein VGB82_06925 [Alphaproteobacteria bacterium]
MKIVHGDEVPFKRGLEYRGGTFHSRTLMEGETGTLGNFSLVLGRNEGDFYSPRHRHNFEQIRFAFEGKLDFDKTGKLNEGMVGYFPEGMSYGPQSQKEGEVSTALVLQFGGASGSGYLSRQQVKAGMDELAKLGEFKDGVFHRREANDGKVNLDAFQAIWEHVNGRPMAYPKPRYESPLFLDPANYDWVPVDGASGVSEKLVGVFTERRAAISFLKLDAGAVHSVAGRGVYFVLAGSGMLEREPFRHMTTLYLDKGERATFTARDTAVILHLGLPNLDGLRAMQGGAMAQAAE